VIELNGELIAEYLWQRELYIGATMIKRRQDEEAQGPEPTTYLGLAVAAPEVGGRFGAKPMVTGAGPVPPALPASGPWAGGDPVGNEEPLNFSIDELPALGGASEPLHSAGVEVSAPQVSGCAEDRTDGEQR
jgi:hypothetical protein